MALITEQYIYGDMIIKEYMTRQILKGFQEWYNSEYPEQYLFNGVIDEYIETTKESN